LLPRFSEYGTERVAVDSFGGLDRRRKIPAGSFYDMNNMTSRDLPALSVRGKRGVYAGDTFDYATGMREINGDIYFIAESKKENVSGLALFKNTQEVDGFTFSSGIKSVAVLGAYIIVFPDKIMYNTLTGSFKKLERPFSGEVNVRLCDSQLRSVTPAAGEVKICFSVTDGELGSMTNTAASAELKNEINRVISSHGYGGDSILLYCPDTCSLKVCPLSGGEVPQKITSLADSDASGTGCMYDIRCGEMYIRQETKTEDGKYQWNKDMPYLRLTADGIASEFSQWDSVVISAEDTDDIAGTYFVGEKTVRAVDEDENCIYVSGVTGSLSTDFDEGKLTVVRPVPDMDIICSHENRLCGCRFQKPENDSEKALNEIYVSKLGEPDNFSLSDSDTGAFAMSVGENGAFTGAVSYNGGLYFFKENCVIVLDRYFSSEVIRLEGVAQDASDSIAQIFGNLIYAGVNGVYLFNGVRTKKISDALGNFNYYPRVGEAYDGRYYLNVIEKSEMAALYSDTSITQAARLKAEQAAEEIVVKSGLKKDSPLYNIYYSLYKTLLYPQILLNMIFSSIKKSRILVYDVNSGVWTSENISSAASCACSDGRNLYYIDYSGKLVAENGSGGGVESIDFSREADFEWFAESGDIGYSTDGRKYISRIGLRISPSAQTRVSVDISYNSSGIWNRLFTVRPVTAQCFTLPVIPVRCDTFRIRLSGEGECTLLSASAVYEEGSDIM